MPFRVASFRVAVVVLVPLVSVLFLWTLRDTSAESSATVLETPVPTVATTTAPTTTAVVAKQTPLVDQRDFAPVPTSAPVTVPPPPPPPPSVETRSVPVETAVPSSTKRCPQFEELARQVGWADGDIDRLSYVMWRESRCQPDAHNPRPPDDSYCLIQLNMLAHRSWVGPLVGGDFNQLFEPETCLRVGLELFRMAGGWGPWKV